MSLLIRRFMTVAVSATALMVLCGGLPLIAQESSASKTESKTKTIKRTSDPSRRVPRYFGQLGLTADQKESIYQIQGKHMPKIEALEKQIEDLRAQMILDCEATLTAAQKQLLEQRRSGVSETRSRKSAPAKAQP
jgi:hypothetical protein